MLKRPNPATGSTFKAPRKPLPKRAAAHRTGQTQQRRVYAALDAESDGRCCGCGGTWFLTHSHCYSQKQYPEHRNDPRNILILCVNCHALYENNKPKFRRVCAEAWAETLRRMKEVDKAAFLRFQTLNTHLFT